MLRFVSDGLGTPAAPRLSRREWLRLGGWGLGGLAGLQLAGPINGPLARRVAQAADRPRLPGFGTARSVIVVFASGGQSQIDTWDPKPDAPAEVRGVFDAISTKVPGVALCEHMPQLARLADRYTIVRSMSHDDLDHGSATYLTLTGHYHRRKSSNPPPDPNDQPFMGSVLKRARPLNRFPYEAITVNGPAQVPVVLAPGQNGGLLGRDYEPLVLGDVSQGPVALDSLDLQADLPPVRMHQRWNLRQSLEAYTRLLESDRQAIEMNSLYAQALELLSSPRYQQAFDLSAEPAALRERYGLHRSGQACLLARRLVEAEVPLVTVVFNHTNRGQDHDPTDTDVYGWDTHNDIFESLEDHLLPRFDQSFSALLEDLDQRGLLDETLVVCLGEFGRAPLVALETRFAGSTPGRKHWANVYSIVMAGAGVARGGVVGASDRIGGAPVTRRIGPWDVTATIFSALGIDPASHYHDALNRPFPLSTGKPIAELYG